MKRKKNNLLWTIPWCCLKGWNSKKKKDGKTKSTNIWWITAEIQVAKNNFFQVKSINIRKEYLKPYYYAWINYYYFTLLRIFHNSVSWWFFTRIWVTVSLLKSPGLFSVFWVILVKLLFRWSLLSLLFPILPVPVPITISIIVTPIFHSFFQFSSKV